MATALSIEILFDAAIRIQLFRERSLQISFTEYGIYVKFPTTRRLADFLDVPHYYVLPYFTMMEQENLVKRAERIGIHIMKKGTGKFFDIMDKRYHGEAEKLLGSAVFNEFLSLG